MLTDIINILNCGCILYLWHQYDKQSKQFNNISIMFLEIMELLARKYPDEVKLHKETTRKI